MSFLPLLLACRSPRGAGSTDSGAAASASASASASADAADASARTADANLRDASSDALAERTRWIEIYYPGWAMASAPPDRIDWSPVSDVVLFGLVPAGGEVDATATAFTTEKLARAVLAARAAGASVLVCVGGEKTGRLFEASTESDGGGRLAASIGAFVEVHGLDGVVLDIEPLGALSAEALGRFVRALRDRSRSGAKPWRVEAVVAPDAGEIARLAPIAASLDRVAMMSYLRSIGIEEERRLVDKLREAGFSNARIGVGLDARSTEAERARRIAAVRGGRAGGLILWHAGTICAAAADSGTPCQPIPSLSK